MSASQLDTLSTKPADDSKFGNSVISFNLEDVNDDKDQLIDIRGGGRYFGVDDGSDNSDNGINSNSNNNVDTIVCRKCFEKGHKEAQCPQVSCSVCGMKNDHYASQCKSKASCFHCGASGHMAKDCPYRNQRVYCSTCHSSSHTSNRCPHIWRSYLTKPQNKSKPLAYPYGKIFCYNCGTTGHFGDDCVKERVSLLPVGNGSAFSGDNMPPQLAGLYWELFNKARRGVALSNRSDIVRRNSYSDLISEVEEKKKSGKRGKKEKKKSEKKSKKKDNDNNNRKRSRNDDSESESDIELALKKKHKGTKILNKGRDFRSDEFQDNVKRERMKMRKSKRSSATNESNDYDNRGEFRSGFMFNNGQSSNYKSSSYGNDAGYRGDKNYNNNGPNRGFNNNFKKGNSNFNSYNNNYNNEYNSNYHNQTSNYDPNFNRNNSNYNNNRSNYGSSNYRRDNYNNGFGNRNFNNNYDRNNTGSVALPKPKRHKAIKKDYKKGGRR